MSVTSVVPDLVPEMPATAPTSRRSRRAARKERLFRPVPILVATMGFNAAVALPHSSAAQAYALAFVLVVPGVMFLAGSRWRPESGFVRLAASVAGSVAILTAIALALSAVGPHVGRTAPLTRWYLTLAVDVVVILLGAWATRRDEPFAVLVGSATPSPRAALLAGGLVALPVTAGAGARILTDGGGSAVSIGVLAVASAVLVAATFTADRLPGWVRDMTLYSVGLALILSFSARGASMFGWDVQAEYRAFSATLAAGVWRAPADGNPYAAMLSITAFPVALTRITGVTGLTLFRLVFPALFALFPVLVVASAQRLIGARAAFAVGVFTVVQLPFAQQLPAIARQEIALLFFGLLVALAFDPRCRLRTRRFGVALAGVALAVTHYSTAYVTAGVIVATWLVFAVMRVARRRDRLQPVFAGWVVVVIVGAVIGWNAGVTHSTGNVTSFARQAAERGPEFLPQARHGSVLRRWLVGNAPETISAAEFYRRASAEMTGKTFLERYPPSLVASAPARDDPVPDTIGPVPAVAELDRALLPIVGQAVLVATALGVCVLLWRRRRDAAWMVELGCAGLAMLGFLALMRVSGVAAAAYNQERAQLHAAPLVGVGLGVVLAWAMGRWRRAGPVLVTGAVAVAVLAASGLAVVAGGGAAAANTSNRADSSERFVITGPEVATARWLQLHRQPGALVFADRYGKLRLWSATTIPERDLFDVLTPGTLDPRSYVFASDANEAHGRARGAVGADQALYAFPAGFLDANKAVIFSTGSTAVYR